MRRRALGARCVPSCLQLGVVSGEIIRADFSSLTDVPLWLLGTAGHLFGDVCDLFSVAPRRPDSGHARSLTHVHAPHGRRRPPRRRVRTASRARPRRCRGATRRRDVPRPPRPRKDRTPPSGGVFRSGGFSAGTSTTGQDATGAEARDESPDVSSRVTWRRGRTRRTRPTRPSRPSTVRPARPPQRPPSELDRGAAPLPKPDARLAPPRASRATWRRSSRWRTKISQAARDVQTAVRRTRATCASTTARRISESLVEEERKMVRDLPRNAGAALSDARRPAGRSGRDAAHGG